MSPKLFSFCDTCSLLIDVVELLMFYFILLFQIEEQYPDSDFMVLLQKSVSQTELSEKHSMGMNECNSWR